MNFQKFVVLLAFVILASAGNPVTKAKKKIKETVDKVKNPSKRFLNDTSGDYCFASQYGLDGPLNKAIVYAPMSPNQMDVKFLLFTCDNKDKSQNFSYLSESSDWKNSNFDPSKMTRFIVHGWIEKYPGNNAGYNWMEQMKNLMLNKSCVNVIAVDWSVPARSVYYYQSAANTRVVGKMIGCVINKLKADLNLSPVNVHLIGHSLGGQVVGFAGKCVTDPKVRQITGLDPAGPGFQGNKDDDKLAVTDGQSVIVIHTNGARTIPLIDGLGDFEPMGNFDFYPNGGHEQTGCQKDEITENLINDIFSSPNKSSAELSDLVLCNHVRSNKYAIADQSYVKSKCQIIGYTCNTYEDFNLGKCAECTPDGSDCRPMPLDLDYWEDINHLDSNAIHAKYYLNTGNVENDGQYCLFHYQIIVSIKNQINPCLGTITIKLSNGKQIDVKLGLSNQLATKEGNKRFTKLFTDSEELGEFNGAEIAPWIMGSICMVNKIEFNYMSNLDESVRKTMSSILCSTDGKTFSNNC